MPKDVIGTRLSQVEDDEEDTEIKVEITDREQEFSKITDILLDIRIKFLGGEDMSFEDALLELQNELSRLSVPKVPGSVGGISGLPSTPVL